MNRTNPAPLRAASKANKNRSPSKRVEHKEKIVDDLRDASDAAGPLDLTLALHNFVDGLATKFARHLLYASVFTRRGLGCVFGYFRLHFSLDLRFHRAMLLRPARFFERQFIVFHFFSPGELSMCR